MNDVKLFLIFFAVVLVSGFSAIAYENYMEHQSYRACLEKDTHEICQAILK